MRNYFKNVCFLTFFLNFFCVNKQTLYNLMKIPLTYHGVIGSSFRLLYKCLSMYVIRWL